MLGTLPNLLTLSRILIIPVLVATFFVDAAWAQWTALALFAVAAITDYLDGYFARARGLQSRLGAFLDPVADKLLVAATLLMLVAVDRIAGISVLAAVVILGREILVSGLREYLAGLNVGLPVTHLAKWKTAIQMVALAVLLVGDAAPAGWHVAEIGIAGLWAAAVLTVASGYGYLRVALGHMTRNPEIPAANAAANAGEDDAAADAVAPPLSGGGNEA